MVSELPPAYSTLDESTVKHKITDKVDMTNDFGEELVDCSFEDKNTRVAFTQKVLSITLLQKLAVSKILFYVNTSYSIRTSISANYETYVVCTGLVYLVTLCLMVFCKEARKKTPYIYIFLALYPVTLGCFINILANGFRIFDAIYIAMGFFCNVLLALLIYSVFALHHKIKFTVQAGIYITMVLLIVSFASTVPFYIYLNDPFGMLYPTMVVFLLSSYILLDLETMVSKPYRLEVTPADFLLGALLLHIDFRYIITKFFKSTDAYIIFVVITVTALGIYGVKNI